MHPLVWLLWRDTRNATWRLLERTAHPRGALAVAGLVLFAAAVGFTTRSTENFGGNVRLFGGPGLTLLVMMGAFSPLGLYFRPADAHWLLTAPLSRTALVLYNVAIRARPALLSGLLLSLLPNWRGAGWWQAFTGYSLIFLLLQTSAQWMAVVRAWLALRARPFWRRTLGVGLFGLPLAAAALELRVRPDIGIREFFGESRVLALVGAPTQSFMNTVAAPDLFSWLLWAGVSVAILGLLIAHICVLPVPYREAAVQQSERRASRFARMRSGGGAFGASRSASHARRVPMFPMFGGAGPVAWRQLQELARNPRGVALILSTVGLVVLAVIGLPLLRGGDPDLIQQLGRTGIFLVTILPLLMGDNLACDFRRDLDRMGLLKSWPISPLALAAGQIAPAALFATSVQAIGVIAVFVATGAVSGATLSLVLLLLPVVSWVALCLDNLLFLWLPYRTVPEDPGDVGFVGRTFATALFKFMSLAMILGGSLGIGLGVLQWTASPVASLLAPISVLLAACVGGTLAVAIAFRRYDVARHAPV
jgi:hypothetical protein